MTEEQTRFYSAIRMEFPHRDVRISSWADDRVYYIEVKRTIDGGSFQLAQCVTHELLRHSSVDQYLARKMRSKFEKELGNHLLGKVL